MRSVNNFGSFGGVARQSTDVPLLKDKQEVEANGRYGPHQRRQRVSIAKTFALVVLVLVTLSGIILTATGAVPRWTPMMGTTTAPSTPPATSRVDNDAMSINNAKFDNITINNKNFKIEDLFPEGFIENVLAYHGYIEKTGEGEEKEMKPKTHKLNKRNDLEVPYDHGCTDAINWRGRICHNPVNERTYINYCYDPCGDPRTGGDEIATSHECAEGFVCTEDLDTSHTRNIKCVPKNQEKEDNLMGVDPPSSRKRQYGYRLLSCFGGCASQIYRSVRLLADIELASFSALFVDQTETYVIATKNEMNANVFGSGIKLCRSGFALDAGGRGCEPKTLWNFRKDNIVSINFGKEAYQTGILFYNIVGH